MIENRDWIHAEAPEGKPSAAAYRLGCRCSECREANAAYMRAYRMSRVAQAENKDGTTVYHSHNGQPSKRTARRWACIHPRCLNLAGLELRDGVVVDPVTGVADATFGAIAAAPSITVEEALAILRKKLVA